MRWPLDSVLRYSLVRAQFSLSSDFALFSASDFSAALRESAWRLRYSCSCSAGVRGPFFASLASFADATGAAPPDCGALTDVVFAPGGGVSPYRTLPSLSTHLYICAKALPAPNSSARQMQNAFTGN